MRISLKRVTKRALFKIKGIICKRVGVYTHTHVYTHTRTCTHTSLI